MTTITDVGFTGSRLTPTTAQVVWLTMALNELRAVNGVVMLHHGDCLGADAVANDVAIYVGHTVKLHPPSNPKHRAYCKGFADTAVPKAYLDRNHDIVDESNFIYALPSGPEQLRSGTWSTVRYAVRNGKTVYGCYPNGRVFERGPNVRDEHRDDR